MFEKREPFNWKMPATIVLGIVVLLTGIYVGIKSIDSKEVVENNKPTKVEKETEKEAFLLNKNCEIVINTKDDSNTITVSTKRISAPSELFNKTEDEIRAYIEENYPNTKIESITQGEILLSELAPYVNKDRVNKYSIEVENGLIGIYKYDINGKRSLVTQTDQKIDILSQKLQQEIQLGITADSIEEIESILDSYLS